MNDKTDRRRKLTDEQYIEIIKQYGEGAPLRVVAQKFGVSISRVAHIVNPKSYENHNRKRAEAYRRNKIKKEAAK